MANITITGWNVGLNKVLLNRLLRQEAGYELGEAKDAVDRLLDGERLTCELPDPESAAAFRRSATALGAVCEAASDVPEGAFPQRD